MTQTVRSLMTKSQGGLQGFASGCCRYIQPENARPASGGEEAEGNVMLDMLLAHVQGSLQSADVQQWLGHRDAAGMSPTQYVMRHLDAVCLLRMVQAGAHVNTPDSRGVPSLYVACRVSPPGYLASYLHTLCHAAKPPPTPIGTCRISNWHSSCVCQVMHQITRY